MVAPDALAEQDKQKQNVLCLENTPGYFYTQTRCFHFDETSPKKNFFFFLFQCETDAAENLESCSKEKSSFPGQLGQGDCQLQDMETNSCRKYFCSQTASFQFFTPQLHSLPAQPRVPVEGAHMTPHCLCCFGTGQILRGATLKRQLLLTGFSFSFSESCSLDVYCNL